MVIAFLGILISMAVPVFDRAVQHQKLYNAAHQLAWDLRLARQEAITTGKTNCVDFYYYANCYAVKNKPRTTFPEGISYKAKPTFVISNSPYIRCSFAPSGAPYPGGSACLTNQNNELLYVIVNLPAGRVRISENPPE